MQTVSSSNDSDRRAASIAAPIGSLGHGFAEDLLRGMLQAVIPPDSTPGEEQDCRIVAAIAALGSLRLRNNMEAMLAAQAIVCHHATMDLFRRANRPGVSDEASMRLRKSAVATMRAMAGATKALERLQAKPVPPPPEAARNEDAQDAEIPAMERAIAGAIEGSHARPEGSLPHEAAMDEAPINEIRMDETFVRERIARAHAMIAERRGLDSIPDPSLHDPFSADTIAAALRAHRHPP